MKKIKMVLYGEPGVGKSVFACHAPKPFFITTDGNYEWLEDFGAKEEDHIQVTSWEEAKKAFSKTYDEYETIVVDLLQDLFKWNEYEYCKKNKMEHISDIGYGKGYDITRNEFFVEIGKLLAKDKNIILLMHGVTITYKDRKGTELNKFVPSQKIPEKVINQIEGNVRFFLRCYTQDEEVNGRMIKKRYLSLVPKANEYGCIRGVNEYLIPQDIELDWKTFIETIENFKLKPNDNLITIEKDLTTISETENIKINKEETLLKDKKIKENVEQENKIESLEEIKAKKLAQLKEKFKNKEKNKEQTEEKNEEKNEEKIIDKDVKEIVENVDNELSKEDKLAKIKAKLLAKKGGN